MQLDDDRLVKSCVRSLVEQHHPALFGSALACPRPRHVHHLIAWKLELSESHSPCFGAENPSGAARGIFGPAQSDKEKGAEENPRGVESGKSIIAHVTRAEIEQKLIDIVRQEKSIPLEKLAPDTSLAEAGIDSLDSLTILFAVEEHFKINIPDTDARAAKTLGDISDAVARQLKIES